MKKIRVSIGKGYDVQVGRGAISHLAEVAAFGCQTVAVVTDDNVKNLYLNSVETVLRDSGLTVYSYSVPAGEPSKSFSALEKLLRFFAKINLTRSDLVVYVGGGVVGDLTAFAASVYLRGVDYVAVPTTLLSMLDSSVGGKTAINLPEGKNLVGTFYQPRAVYADVTTLSTLSDVDWQCGIGEAVKYAMIADPYILQLLKRGREPDALTELIVRGIEVKRSAVEADVFDKGIRQTLNFGHTLGHVIETQSKFCIPHGVAVGLGMTIITRWSEKKGWTEKGTAEQINCALRAFGMPTEYDLTAEELLALAINDKKRKGNLLTLVILKRTGECYLKDVEAQK